MKSKSASYFHINYIHKMENNTIMMEKENKSSLCTLGSETQTQQRSQHHLADYDQDSLDLEDKMPKVVFVEG